MLLKDAMFLWRKIEEGDSIPFGTYAKVVQHPISESDRVSFRWLTKSMGACCAGWRETTDLARAAHALTLFQQMVIRDKINAQDVHEAFMAIDEYRAYSDGCTSSSNAFVQAYWAFSVDNSINPLEQLS